MKLLLLLAAFISAAEDHEGYEAMIERMRGDMSAVVQEAEQKVLAPEKKACDDVSTVGGSVGAPSGELTRAAAALPPNDVVPQTTAKTAASTQALGWRSKIAAAKAAQQQAARALQQLLQSDKAREVEQALPIIDRQLMLDRRVVDDGLGIGPTSTDKDIEASRSRAHARLVQADRENKESRADYEKQKERWTKFKEEVQQGRIREFDRKCGQLVQQADTFIGQVQPQINALIPGAGQAFGIAGQAVGRGSSLKQDVGYAQAKQAADDTQRFAK